MPTSLRHKMVWQIGALVVGPLLMGIGAALGIAGLHSDIGLAQRGYQQQADLYEVGFFTEYARLMLQSPRNDAAQALDEITEAKSRLAGARDWLPEPPRAQEELREKLAEVEKNLFPPAPHPLQASAQLASLNNRIIELHRQVSQFIQAREQAAEQKRALTLLSIVLFCAAVVAGAIAVGIRQYRSVVRPLDRLSDAVKKLAARQFTGRIAADGPDARALGSTEFVALAADFNHMAETLDAFYRDLENQVRLKSRELVRSERLASVGYLAAGVAHEINNPLGIIAGYAESALADLADQPPSDPSIEKSLCIICEEAFRCKQITDRLLALSRPGGSERTRVSLREIARQTIANVKGLPLAADRPIALDAAESDPFDVTANEGEMKQVMLNLLINALEAIAPAGQVTIALRRTNSREGQAIELALTDTGRGMAPATLERVFEPFFSEGAEQRGRAGTGLGLSITHAIVQDHGGTLHAESEGPSKGSRFTVILPAKER